MTNLFLHRAASICGAGGQYCHRQAMEMLCLAAKVFFLLMMGKLFLRFAGFFPLKIFRIGTSGPGWKRCQQKCNTERVPGGRGVVRHGAG
ncbi:MAG: hypothetical protein ACI33N_00055 [Desulfovibrionaceae bacterium]